VENTASQATRKYSRPVGVRRWLRIHVSNVWPSSSFARLDAHGWSSETALAARLKRAMPWARSASTNGLSLGTAPRLGAMRTVVPPSCTSVSPAL